MRVPTLVLLAFALTLAACSAPQTGLDGMPYFETAEEVYYDFEVIGYVNPVGANARAGYAPPASKLQEAKRAAYALGADAVLKRVNDSPAIDAAMQDFARRAGSGATGGGLQGVIVPSRVQYLAIRFIPGTLKTRV